VFHTKVTKHTQREKRGTTKTTRNDYYGMGVVGCG
jgi:hypothetical protein